MSNVKLSAFILTSLLEGAAPNGHLYAIAMQYVDIDQWQAVIAALIHEGQITESHHLLSLTVEGRDLAVRIEDRINIARF